MNDGISAQAPEFSGISGSMPPTLHHVTVSLLPADMGSVSIQTAYVSTVTPSGSDNNPGLFNGLNRFLAFFLDVNLWIE